MIRLILQRLTVGAVQMETLLQKERGETLAA